MSIKKIVALILSLVMALSLAACGGGGSTTEYATPEKPMTVKWGLSVSPTNQAYINAEIVANHVKEATNGAIIVELCPSGQLGGESAMWEGVQSGTIDMANISTGTLSNTIPEFESITLPFVFRNAETFWNVVSQDEFREKFTEVSSKHGVVFLGFSSMFNRGIASKEPIVLPSDIKDQNMKLRIMSGHTYSDMFKSWDAGTITIAFGEVYTSLQQGACDGLCVDIGGAVDQKFFEQAPYFVNTFHAYHASPLMMRKSLWDSLSPDQQQAFVDGFKEVGKVGVDTYYADIENCTQKALEMGVTFTYLTPEQKQVWIDAVEWMYSDYEYIDSEFQAWFMQFIEDNYVESSR